MELYTALAKDFARRGRKQILAIFIRDVNPEPSSHQHARPSTRHRISRNMSGLLGGSRSSSPAPPAMNSWAPAASNDDGTFLGVTSASAASAGSETLIDVDSTPGLTHSPEVLPDRPDLLAPPMRGVLNERPGSITPRQGPPAVPPRPSFSGGYSSVSDASPTPTMPVRRGSGFPFEKTPTSHLSSSPSSSSSSGAYSRHASMPTPSTPTQYSTTYAPRHQTSTSSSNSEPEVGEMSDPALAQAISSVVSQSEAQTTPSSLNKKRAEFKIRLEKVKEGMPPDVQFVVFTDPAKECVGAADGLLNRLWGLQNEGGGGTPTVRR